MDWFLYDNGLRHERVKQFSLTCKDYDLRLLEISLQKVFKSVDLSRLIMIYHISDLSVLLFLFQHSSQQNSNTMIFTLYGLFYDLFSPSFLNPKWYFYQ